MQEHYIGWGRLKRLSWKEIQEMQRNMKKVEDIKEKSKAYHKKEIKDLDQLLKAIEE